MTDPNASDVVQALASVAALAVAAAGWRVASRASRTERSVFVAEMRREWAALGDDWASILILVNGTTFYYSEASQSERQRVADLKARVEAGLDMESTWPSPIALERMKVRRVSRFFVHAADAILRGEWTIDEAYAFFGPDVARHYETLVWLAHEPDGYRTPEGKDVWKGWIEALPEFNNYDEQDVLYLFAYLMRAEQCRRGDTYAHFVLQLARQMRGGLREHLRILLRRTLRRRRRFTTPVGVRRALSAAYRPSVSSVHLNEASPITRPGDEKLLRPRARSLKWVGHRIHTTRQHRDEALATRRGAEDPIHRS